MKIDVINELLPFIERPSRYLGSEFNSVHKDFDATELKFLLAFPDIYEIGTSHFGIQILYNILNQMPEVMAERVFTPDVDLDALLRATDAPLFALESHRAAAEFDIIGFSLLYELNYTNVLSMLDLAGLPFFAQDRNDTQPLIIAGGPCACNPEPVAEFFDAIVIGDGELVAPRMAQIWLEVKRENGHVDKAEILRRWAKIQGVYVPVFFETYAGKQGQLLVRPREGYSSVKRAILPDLDAAVFPVKPVIPFSRPVHDRLRIEVARGCANGCRFCQAGMIYRPVRERSPQNIMRLMREALSHTGYEDVSMLSLSTGDYSQLLPLMTQMMGDFARDKVAVSLPSLRAGSLRPKLMELIKTVRKTGFTIAPEAGSQRLRDVINKNISEADIFNAVENAFAAGWQSIKLYFMIGLPTETKADLEAMINLVLRLRALKCFGKRGNLSVSIGLFVPKPHTPFQWEPMLDPDAAHQRFIWLKEQMMRPGIQIKWHDTRVSLVEGVWSRGDRRLARVLVKAYENGCRFDGWTEHFDFVKWQQTFAQCDLDVAIFTTNPPPMGTFLSFEHIDMGVARDFLLKEYDKALKMELTPACLKACSACGICDFKAVSPIMEHAPFTAETPPQAVAAIQDFVKIQVYFVKTGKARFFGHLEMLDIILRAMRRADITVAYSTGFHPKPKISFGDTLPLGMESLHEVFNLQMARKDLKDFRERLNASLPEGLEVSNVVDVTILSKRDLATPDTVTLYEAHLLTGSLDEATTKDFMTREQFEVSFERKPGQVKTMDLRFYVETMEICANNKLRVAIGRDAKNNTIRPQLLLEHVFGLDKETVQKARIIKIY